MKLSFIASGVEREATRLAGIEIQAVAQLVSSKFDTLVFGGSSIGLMEAFAAAFASHGGVVVSVVPRWLERSGLAYKGCEPVLCDGLADRKRILFDETDAVLCYPGGIGTWDELFHFLAMHATERTTCPPVYLYNWEKYYAPLLLQIETAIEVGLIHPHAVESVRAFETVEALAEMLTDASEDIFVR